MLEGSQTSAQDTVSVQATAHSLIAVYGVGARDMTVRHIVRCLEQNLIDEVMFWLKVRNQIDGLMRTSRRADDVIQ